MTAWQAADSRSALDAITLEHIRVTWDGIYGVGYVRDAEGYPDGVYLARYSTGGNLLTAGTPEGLDSAIRADFCRRIAR